MSGIAVVHPDLNKKGGAEAVSMNILNSLSDSYDVDLISLTSPKKSELESYYDIPLTATSISTAGAIGPALERGTTRLSETAGVGNLGVLDVALTNRLARRKEANYELIISTMSEMNFDTQSIQYIHFPNFNRRTARDKSSLTYSVYESFCQKLSGTNNHPMESTTYLANSRWTAGVFQDIYGICPDVLYPPVDTRGFSPLPWEDREEGILVVGRIGKDKRILGILDTFESLKDQGYNGHLHIVGPVHDQSYYNRVCDRAREIPSIEVKSAVSRSELVSLMSSHRYAIHGKEEEHFGMVIAEFVAAGMIPFLPDSGGQPEIVGDDPMLLYEPWDELLSKLSLVMEDRDIQYDILERLPNIKENFGTKRFQKDFNQVVERYLD